MNHYKSLGLTAIGFLLICTRSLVLGCIGVIVILLGFVLGLRFLRCPYCKDMVEMRGQSFCGSCGGDLRNVPEP